MNKFGYRSNMATVDETKVLEPLMPKYFSPLAFTWVVIVPILSAIWAIFYIVNYGIHFAEIFSLVLMYTATGLAITAGYHRFLSHRAYQASRPLELFFLLFGAAAFQNSALEWASNHRYHHRHVDSEADFHNIKKGFFWAHVGWIYWVEPKNTRPWLNAADLKNDALVMWQYRYYIPIGVVMGFLLPTLIGACFGHPVGGFLFGGWLRMSLIYQSTGAINSLAHMFGKQTYNSGDTSRDNPLLALISFGEGFHCFHHTFPSDYRNGLAWYHWDPSKWMIYLSSRFGFASDLKRTTVERIQQMRRVEALEDI